MAFATGSGDFNRSPCIEIALALPQVGPETTLDRIEVSDFHDAFGDVRHEYELAIKIENLDAVARRSEHALEKRALVRNEIERLIQKPTHAAWSVRRMEDRRPCGVVQQHYKSKSEQSGDQ